MEQNQTDGRGLLVRQGQDQPKPCAGCRQTAHSAWRGCQSRKRLAAHGDAEVCKLRLPHAATSTAASSAPNTRERMADRLNLKVSSAEARYRVRPKSVRYSTGRNASCRSVGGC